MLHNTFKKKNSGLLEAEEVHKTEYTDICSSKFSPDLAVRSHKMHKELARNRLSSSFLIC